MRVGYIFNNESIVGGGEISLLDLLEEIRRFGVIPVAFVPGKGAITERLDAMGIAYVIAPWPHLNLWSFPGLIRRINVTAREFAEQRLDLVHVNGARSMLYAAPAAGKANLPVVWHVRVVERDCILDKVRAHYASAIVANSEAVRTSLAGVIGHGRKIDIIYNGLYLERGKQSRPADLKKEYALPDAPIVVCIGRISTEKALENAITACGILQGRGVELSLLLVGGVPAEDKKYEQYLRDIVADKGVCNVVFSVWRDDVYSIMKAVNVLVVASLRESFGRVIVEAWTSGLPVVSTNCGGPAELIENGVSGLLVPVADVKVMADAIEKVLKDGNFAKNLADAGTAKAGQFSIGRHAEQVMDLYRRLTAKR